MQAIGCDPMSTAVPSLSDIGYPPTATTPFRGGETAALARMAEYLADRDWVAGFEKPKTNPAHFTRPATTVLSPYLKFGCLSARLFHAKLLQIYREKKKHTEPPVSLRCALVCNRDTALAFCKWCTSLACLEMTRVTLLVQGSAAVA